MLRAQTTDRRVNAVRPTLFAAYPDPTAMAAASREHLEQILGPLGFFRAKTDALLKLSQALVEHYDGQVPGRLDDLVTLPGVGRKTANVVLGNAFGVPGITVDTHFGRLVRRFGWTEETDPVKVEHAVGALFPRRDWTMLSHHLIWHGRRAATPRSPHAAPARSPGCARPSARVPTDPVEAEKLVKHAGPRVSRLLAVVLLAAGLSACSPGSDELGFDINPPDVQVDTPALRKVKARIGMDDCAPATVTRSTTDCPTSRWPASTAARGGPASLRGPAVIYLWEARCEPCRLEMPVLEEFHQQHGDRVAVLGIDFKDAQPGAALALAEDTSVTYPLLADPGGEIMGEGAFPIAARPAGLRLRRRRRHGRRPDVRRRRLRRRARGPGRGTPRGRPVSDGPQGLPGWLAPVVEAPTRSPSTS